MRVQQRAGSSGSLGWIQKLSSTHAGAFEAAARRCGALAADATFTWLSPLESDEWAEYRDGSFLDLLGLSDPKLDGALKAFWPVRGPQWDGLGRDSGGVVYLMEAKAHVAEMKSSCMAGKVSGDVILKSLADARRAFGARPDADWLNGHYQYANRLAHLDFLRRNGIDARLVFLYFTNDKRMGGPRTVDEWRSAVDVVLDHLGLKGLPLPGVHDVFVDVSDLAAE